MSVMSSDDNSTGPTLLAFICQKIRPAAKSIATAAAMYAFFVEFKILSFPNAKDAEPVRAVPHSRSMDEQKQPGIRRRPPSVFHRSSAPPCSLDRQAKL